MAKNFFTTTDLRTKSSILVDILKSKGKISLIHRSQIIGEILPKEAEEVAIKDIKPFSSFLKTIKPKTLVSKSNRKRLYKKKLLEKYGKNIS